MNKCMYCGNEKTEVGDFCGDCGLIRFSEEETALKRLIKQFKYIFINPVAFIHTTKLVNPIFTGVAVTMIFLIQLILLRMTGVKQRLFVTGIYSILIIIGIVAVESLFMFGISKGIYKKDIKYIQFCNLVISVQLISSIIITIARILGVVIHPIIFSVLGIFGVVISLLLLYQGIEDYIRGTVMIHLVIIIGSISGTTLVAYIILSRLMARSLRLLF